jgi:hypothetical protein
MHSNFVTPPDYITSVLIIGATGPETQACATAVKESGTSYNIYFYNEEMNDLEWLNKIMFRVDAILLQENQLKFTVPTPIGFGPNCLLKSPAEYFTK